MKFHYIAQTELAISELPFGASLKGLNIAGATRAAYVTIDKVEFEATVMTEQQMMIYFTQLKKSLDFGGKIYIEATPY